ncbi:hypothetical protein BHM03_00008168 [Ensete ventricosum]|nr:hypothetical protein BHM03_00008168 [Ensete ventricosum]
MFESVKNLHLKHTYLVDNHQKRGMHRRCLVFEVASVSKRNMYSDFDLNPSTSFPSKGKRICDSNNLEPKISRSLCALSGIGLHLNTLATTSKDRMANKETLSTGKQPISIPCSIDPFPSTTAEDNSLRKPFAAEKDLRLGGSELDPQIISYDAPKDDKPNNSEELNQGSPKKKSYCECFAAGVYCSEPCSCQGCFNKPIHEETVLATRKQIESRNPLAFAPKVIRTHDSGLDMGVRVSLFGLFWPYNFLTGILPGVEIEQVEKESDVCEKEIESSDDVQLHHAANVQVDEHHTYGEVLPITPYQHCR